MREITWLACMGVIGNCFTSFSSFLALFGYAQSLQFSHVDSVFVSLREGDGIGFPRGSVGPCYSPAPTPFYFGTSFGFWDHGFVSGFLKRYPPGYPLLSSPLFFAVCLSFLGGLCVAE